MKHLIRQLRSWQRREWLYSACVAVAALILLVVVGVTFACLIDYWADSEQDTPFWLRVLLVVVQVIVYLAAVVLAVRLVRAPSLVTLAGRAETVHREFDHRLVTALQLNQPSARIEGMSKQLINTVTEEAVQQSARHTLSKLADPNRLLIALGLLVPVLLIGFLAFVFFRPQAIALLQRQFLQDVEIPRSVTIENLTAPLFPAGDAVEVQLRVTGRVSESDVGRLFVTPDGGSREQHELRYAGALDGDAHLYHGILPPASEPFRFTARVRDGRLKTPQRVEFVPRPVVTDVAAWVRMPAYIDPIGKRRYEKMTNQGEVTCFADCSVRVEIQVSKPVKKAELVLTGRGIEQRVPMTLTEPTTATTTFDIPPGVNAYRVEVADEHGFRNLTAPRRGITILPDRPPLVTLNDEVLMPAWETGPLDDFEVRGMPLVIGGQIQIAYTAKSALGLERAFVVYRVNDGPWTALPLTQVEADEEKVGKFRLDLGVFSSYDVDRNVEFYPLPSRNPDEEPSGLTAGGRYNFQTAELSKPGPDGNPTKLEIGDRVEFRVGVYDRRPGRRIPMTDLDTASRRPEERIDQGRPAGYSESRIKAVVTQVAFDQWREQQVRSRERLREVEKAQRGVFGRPDNR
jgi:hypothetical protein